MHHVAEESTTNVEKQTRNLRDEIKNLYAQLNTKSEDARKVQDELKVILFMLFS